MENIMRLYLKETQIGMEKIMTFDKETLLAFIAMYLDAKENKVEVFTFAGQEVLTGYAKYMIQYATSQWGEKQ
jgi:hypothetical protein